MKDDILMELFSDLNKICEAQQNRIETLEKQIRGLMNCFRDIRDSYKEKKKWP